MEGRIINKKIKWTIITIIILYVSFVVYIGYPTKGTFGELILDKIGLEKYTAMNLMGIDTYEEDYFSTYDEEEINEIIPYLESIEIRKYNMKPSSSYIYDMVITGPNNKLPITKINVRWYEEGVFSVNVDNSPRLKYYKIEDEDFDMDKVKAMFGKK